ncbi:hypothetical protein EVAR_102730_1 [Eumeta japonica]|uniref:Uncharacterized protein n=1 Tax=Eumeta variegata TaxID=151549 RepID=A0A4C1TKS3_EUMVA|nr:hypothetical protein EVAR_102730_1 [Eumeta japonica]
MRSAEAESRVETMNWPSQHVSVTWPGSWVTHVPLTGTDDSRTAQCLVNTARGVVLSNQAFSNSFSPEPLHADEHYHAEE